MITDNAFVSHMQCIFIIIGTRSHPNRRIPPLSLSLFPFSLLGGSSGDGCELKREWRGASRERDFGGQLCTRPEAHTSPLKGSWDRRYQANPAASDVGYASPIGITLFHRFGRWDRVDFCLFRRWRSSEIGCVQYFYNRYLSVMRIIMLFCQ